MRKRSKPTRYPGVHDHEDGTFRLRGRVRHTKTGEVLDLEEKVTAKNPHEAKLIRDRRLAELACEGAPAPQQDRPKLEAYVLLWMATKLPKLAPSTRSLYATIFDSYILPPLGAHYVDAINLGDLVAWRDAQASAPTKYARAPSAVTVNGRIRLLKSVMADATHDLDLKRDPSLRLETLREDTKRKNSLSAAELARFLEAARKHSPAWYPFFYALAFTGLRFGELTALRWRDIDEELMIACVDLAQWKGHEGKPKTKQSRRPVPFDAEFLSVLHAHRAAQLEARKRKAKREQVTAWDALSIGADELVFHSPRALKHMHNTAPRRALTKCLAKAGIESRFTIHGSRHTFNNLLRLHSKDLVLVREMMGHAEGDGSISVRYSEVELEEQRTARTGLRLVVGAGKGKPC